MKKDCEAGIDGSRTMSKGTKFGYPNERETNRGNGECLSRGIE